MRTKSYKYPLRRIIGARRTSEGLTRELLECGHEIPEKSDLYGPTTAQRRRCRHCYRELKGKGEG